MFRKPLQMFEKYLELFLNLRPSPALALGPRLSY